ncbi:hypothetical protein [Portibacter marinus]|uniref:hypothetical protein n=1 Tax=Portibacter marinus TaxID=2898660 RepID=UPI001F1EA1CB|nr:hypothetical protein [Portibacter marinus]
MNRRKAMGLMALAAGGMTLFPSCQFTKVPTLDHLQIDKSTYKKLVTLSSKILPIPEEQILENMSPADFVLIMMDDCNTVEAIDKFTSGMTQFFEEYEVDEINEEQLSAMLEENDFLQKVKGYNVWYYQGLETYLNSFTDYEFIPARFIGCAKV